MTGILYNDKTDTFDFIWNGQARPMNLIQVWNMGASEAQIRKALLEPRTIVPVREAGE